MARLSTCYFCGVATVADLGEICVADDDAATVTLCGDCANKLDRLADAAGAVGLSITDVRETARRTGDPDVSSGASRAAAADTTRQDTERAGDDGEGSTGTDDATTPPAADGRDVETATAATETDSDGEPAGDPAPTTRPTGTEPGIPEDARIFTDSTGGEEFEDDPLAGSGERIAESTGTGDGAAGDATTAAEGDTDEATTGAGDATTATGDDTDEPAAVEGDTTTAANETADRSDRTDPRSFAASQAAGGRRETSHGGHERRSNASSGTGTETEPRKTSSDTADAQEAATAEAADGATTAEAEDAEGEASEAEDGPGLSEVDAATVSRETYDRVVRLLQNRSFPVERDTVVSVAAAAYGIDRRDCDRTIDALIQRDALDEGDDGDELFRA